MVLSQASSLLKKTEGVVTLVVCNSRKDDSGAATEQKHATDKPKQPEKPSKSASLSIFKSGCLIKYKIS